MSDQGTPARDTTTDKDHDTSGDVSEQNGEEQPEPAGDKRDAPDEEDGA